jgi:hypothetical protein
VGDVVREKEAIKLARQYPTYFPRSYSYMPPVKEARVVN